MNKIVNDERVRRLMGFKSLLGEGTHPEERFDTIYPQVALSVEDLWVSKEDESKLFGRFAILDTPLGKILHTLLEYGSKIGVSARASGTSTVNESGVEVLDEDTYEFYTFDAVPEPGFSCARPTAFHESLKKKGVAIKDYTEEELKLTKGMMESCNKEFFR